MLGGGTPYFPPLDQRIALELVETRTFGSRVVYLRYRAGVSCPYLRQGGGLPAGPRVSTVPRARRVSKCEA